MILQLTIHVVVSTWTAVSYIKFELQITIHSVCVYACICMYVVFNEDNHKIWYAYQSNYGSL